MGWVYWVCGALAGGYIGYAFGYWLASRHVVTEIEHVRNERLPIVTLGRNITLPVKPVEGNYLGGKIR